MDELTNNVTEEVMETAAKSGSNVLGKVGVAGAVLAAGYGVGKGVEWLVRKIRARKATAQEDYGEVEIEDYDEEN